MFLVRVESVGGLVQDKHRRIVQQRLGQADAALETLGKRIDGLGQHIGDIGAFDCQADGGAAAPAGEPPHGGHKGEEGTGGHVAVKRRPFRQITEIAPGPDRVVGHIVAANRRAAFGRSEKPCDHLHRRGLAGTVGSEKAQNLAHADLEIHAVHDHMRIEALRQTLCGNQRQHFVPNPGGLVRPLRPARDIASRTATRH